MPAYEWDSCLVVYLNFQLFLLKHTHTQTRTLPYQHHGHYVTLSLPLGGGCLGRAQIWAVMLCEYIPRRHRRGYSPICNMMSHKTFHSVLMKGSEVNQWFIINIIQFLDFSGLHLPSAPAAHPALSMCTCFMFPYTVIQFLFLSVFWSSDRSANVNFAMS